MEQRLLGSSDLAVSEVGLGCNNFGGRLDLERTRAVVDAALDAGVTFLDTADVYGNRGGSERFLGEILEGRRDDVVIATKFGWDLGADGDALRGTAEYVRQAIEASLERLRTDHVDLYYYHRPDGVTPFEETLGAMHELVADGKTRYIGCSNLTAEQLREVHEITTHERDDRDRGAPERVQPARARCRRGGAAALPRARHRLRAVLPAREWAPHRQVPAWSGRSAREPARGPPRAADRRALRPRSRRSSGFADERGHTILELAIGALVSTPGVASVIAGATTPEQVRANAAAAGSSRRARPPTTDRTDLREIRRRHQRMMRPVA